MAEKLNATAKKKDGIRPDVLKALINKCDSMKAKQDSARGDLGAAIKDAEDTHGIHRKAFKQALALRRMEPEARDDYLRALDDYRQKLDLNPEPDLFEEGQGDEEQRRAGQAEKQAADDQAAENGKKIAKGIKSLDAVH